MITLRDYQQDCARAMLDSLRAGHNPIAAVATGGGKSLIIGYLASLARGRVLVATHRKELLVQNRDELLQLVPDADVGIYSAGVGERSIDNKIIMGGIQSIHKRMDELQRMGPFTAVIVDESHRVPPKSKKSMYRTIIESCPEAVRMGFTATPYRMDNGPLHEGPGAWFDDLAYEAGIRDLTDKGYLTPLVGVETRVEPNLKGIKRSGGDYSLSELSERMSEDDVIEDAMTEMMSLAVDRKSWLVFCVDVKHCELVCKQLQNRDVDTQVVVGTTPADERDRILEQFKKRQIRALVSCEVLTTGSNLPCVDCVIVLRATQSKGLFVQMIGRGTRLYPDQETCMLLDMGLNIPRHAPIAGLEDVHSSPRKQARDKVKEMCEHRREDKKRKPRHGRKAYEGDIWADKPPRELRVRFINYDLQASKNQLYVGKINVVASYACSDGEDAPTWVKQWLCVEYPPGGRAAKAAAEWFKRRGRVMPTIAGHALNVAKSSRRPVRITVQRDKGYDRIVEEVF